MVEVIVSAVVVIILAVATLNVIDRSTSQASTNQNRSTASSLANAELNRLRQLQIDDAALVSGSYDKSVGIAPNIRTFHIKTTAKWASDKGPVDLSCASTDKNGASYLRVSTSVTWDNMGDAKPVVADAIIAPRTSGNDAFRGTLVFKVQDRDGNPVPGVAVTVLGESANTDDAGCVIFPRLPQGDATVVYQKLGYVDLDGNAPGTEDVSIAAGFKSIVTVSFDAAVTVPVREMLTDGSAYSGWTQSVTLASERATPNQKNITGWPVNFGNLYPFVSGYWAYAGDCAGNDPSTYISDAATQLPGSSVTVTPGTTAPTTYAYLRTLPTTFTVPSGYGSPMAKITLNTSTMNGTTPYMDTGCDVPTAPSFSLSGTTATASPLPMPFGLYNVCLSASKPGTWPWSPPTTRYHVYPYNNLPSGTKVSGAPSPTSQTPGWGVGGSDPTSKPTGC